MNTRLDAMRLGNPGGALAASAGGRDLGMRKREYWETRPHPAHVHHWLEAEFEAFLREHSYPPNNIGDRLVERVRSIAAALKKGLYVPPAVMQEPSGVEALADAILHVQAEDQAVRAEDRFASMCDRFGAELTIRFGGDEELAKKALVLAAFGGAMTPNSGATNAIGSTQCSRFDLDGLDWKLGAYIAHFRRSGGGSRTWLSIRLADLPMASLYGELCRIDGGDVDVIATRAMLDGTLQVSCVRALMGYTWAPPLIHSSGSVAV